LFQPLRDGRELWDVDSVLPLRCLAPGGINSSSSSTLYLRKREVQEVVNAKRRCTGAVSRRRDGCYTVFLPTDVRLHKKHAASEPLDHFEVEVSSNGAISHELVDMTFADRVLLGLKVTTALRQIFDMKHKLTTSASCLSLPPRSRTCRVIA
jgi:hypothetical protein